MKPTDIQNPVQFLTAGKAVFTVLNDQTGSRFTYRVSKHAEKSIYFVSVLTGPNNDADYSYMGLIREDQSFSLTAKSNFSKDVQVTRAFGWLWDQVINGRSLPPGIHLYHEGRCCRCGRRLTTPESIQAGIGPECASKGGF